jgi:type IV pilus assembly protein PilM
MGSMKQADKTYTKKTLFFEDKPLFGLDIGDGSLRVIQLDMSYKKPRVKGYGSVQFDPAAVNKDGVVMKPEIIAKESVKLFQKQLVGDITTKRVAVALPASRTLSRVLHMPKIDKKDLDEAVRTEANQYIPASPDDLYMDYTILREDNNGIEVFAVSVPKQIVDSYLLLTRMLGLEALVFDTTIGANAQIFNHDPQHDVPTVLIDFGSVSSDISVYNRGLIVTGTVSFGGSDVTRIIEKQLRVSSDEAVMLKSKYGLGPSKIQKLVLTAMEASLQNLIKEIRRTIRYYEERYSKDEPIGQVVVMGGGANMPGLSGYLTDQLRVPVRAFDPASHIDFGRLKPFPESDRASFVTVSGLATINPESVFK